MIEPRVKLEKTLYTASAKATSGREGRVASSDGAIDLAVAMPRELGGAGGAGTNPEQLFAAGYAACFGSAAMHVARMQRIASGPITVHANVSIGPAGAGFGLAVELVADIPELPREQAEALLRAAHEVCPYSNATRGNIAVEVRLA
jgi:osmotically inducible protein OsmC